MTEPLAAAAVGYCGTGAISGIIPVRVASPVCGRVDGYQVFFAVRVGVVVDADFVGGGVRNEDEDEDEDEEQEQIAYLSGSEVHVFSFSFHPPRRTKQTPESPDRRGMLYCLI